MKIREFNLDDYPSIFELWKESGLEIRPGDDLEGLKLKRERDPDLFLVAEDGGRIVGGVIGGWDGRRGFIWHLAVKPGFQRRGIARALVKEVEERLAKKGATIVYAFVLATNTRSRDFFTASAYDITTDQVIVRKDLRKSAKRDRGFLETRAQLCFLALAETDGREV